MRRTLLARILTTGSLILAMAGTVHAGDVTLTWNANTEPDIAGYVLWYGTQPGRYITSIDVGNRTEWTLSGLADGQRYYFAVQAYNAARTMSLSSTEISADVVSDTATNPPSGGTDTTRCTTPRPGPNWICNADGGWVPPGHPDSQSTKSSGTSASSSTAGSGTVPCTTPRPAPNWICNTSNGGWLPPGHPEAQRILSEQPPVTDGTQGEVLYLFQLPSGSPLVGWTVLIPDAAATDQYDVYRNNSKIGRWSGAASDAGVQLTYTAGAVGLTVAGAADLVAWRPSTGIWYVLKSADGTVFTLQTTAQWGHAAAKDIPVPGDYDGDGQIDLAVWRPSIGTWYVLRSSENYDAQRSLAIQWGESGDAPVQGDYDGDGRTDLAVWRSSTSTSLVLKSSEGYNSQQCLAVRYGNSTAASPCSVTVRASGS